MDTHKTKEQLIQELSTLRQRLTKLESFYSEHGRIKDDLRKSEDKYHKLMETANDAIFIANADTGIIIDANKKAEELLGIPVKDIKGIHQSELHPREEAERYREIFEKHIQTGKAIEADIFVVNKTGSKIPVEISANVTEFGNTKIVQGIFRDITERKKTEEALAKADTEWSQAMDSSKDINYLLDLNRHILRANKAFYALTGLKPETTIGRHIVEVIHPEGEIIPCPVCLAQDEKQDLITIMEADHPDNPAGRPLEITVRIVKDAEGQPMSIYMNLHDLTESRKMEEAIKESELRYRALFEQSPDAIVLIDPENTRPIAFNRRAPVLLGYTDEEFEKLEVSDYEIIESADEVRSHKEKVIHEGEDEFETKFRTKMGEIKDVIVKIKVIELSGKSIFHNIFRDITELKKAEKEQERLTEELLIKNKELEQLLYVTSHDLRSPLVNVEGYSKELEYSLKEIMSSIENVHDLSSIKEKITEIVIEDIPESLHYIQISISKMNTLLKGVLTLSRLGRSKLTTAEIDMNAMVTDIIDSHSFRMKELRIKTEVSKLPICKGDSSQINQVFSNLLDNTIKYADSKRSCVINISGYKDKNQSVYCIEDNGIGIAPEHQDKIFEIFHQLEPNRFEGEGMGLTIAHKIIERHKGKIWVESELGRGSKFFVSLPAN